VHDLALLVLFYSITNFLKSLFCFIVRSFSSWVPSQVLDVSFACFTDINDFASSGALFSSFLLTNLYFSLSLYTCFHSFIICRVYKFSNLGANACLAENADILLLSHTSISNCLWVFYYFTVGCGFCEQPQVYFFSCDSLMVISGFKVSFCILCDLFSQFFVVRQWFYLIFCPFKNRK
jgi:hypothetical protein